MCSARFVGGESSKEGSIALARWPCASRPTAQVEIDGSMLEGGGAIVRIASALSVLSGKPVRIHSIRAGRSQPGLRVQHLRSLEALLTLCGGKLDGGRLGSREIYFCPGETFESHIRVRIETAGSVGLVLQALLVAMLAAREITTAEISGGATFGKYAPPVQYIQLVLLPLLKAMGCSAEIEIVRHGFYPVGGSLVRARVQSTGELRRLLLLEQGDVNAIEGVSIASRMLKKRQVAERQARAATSVLENRGYRCGIKTSYVDSSCPGSGVVLAARTSTGCALGADGLGEKGKPAKAVGRQAAKGLLRALESGSTVDEHMSDQVLPYLALARGRSAVIAPSLTMHAKTNMTVITEFVPVDFELDPSGPNVRVACAERCHG